jgi:hypothetical protein
MEFLFSGAHIDACATNGGWDIRKWVGSMGVWQMLQFEQNQQMFKIGAYPSDEMGCNQNEETCPVAPVMVVNIKMIDVETLQHQDLQETEITFNNKSISIGC